MLSFMDYVVNSFGDATNWNRDNAYSSLTATSEAILDFPTPQHLRLNVSSLASPQFATSYSLGTLGLLDGSISYLYTTLPMRIPSQTPSIPLRTLIEGYRQLSLPLPPSSYARWQSPRERKDTLLSATLHLPSPSRLNGLYLRRISPETLVTLSLNSTRSDSLQPHSPPPSALLAHLTHDTGKYSVEGLASSDNALLGLRGLWNFGRDLSTDTTNAKSPPLDAKEKVSDSETNQPLLANSQTTRPSLLSAGGEFYYSPLSSAIGLSTGLRFTTLTTAAISDSTSASPRSSKPLSGTSTALSSQFASQVPTAGTSSFPYTLTLTLTPLTGSLASTYSVRPSPNLSLSSRFGFNVYSWESEYVVGAEIWHKKRSFVNTEQDNLLWAREKMATWYEDTKSTVLSPDSSPPPPPQRLLDTTTPIPATDPPLQVEESVLKLRLDDGFNFRALWTGRIKSLLVSAGLSVGPQRNYSGLRKKTGSEGVSGVNANGIGGSGPWRGGIGVEVVYSS